ncbi:FAD/NAD(P)-binding protein [Photobacterium leiognathi subsp. mandapamensis]|uniref:FAD/NAD(P)-binding protein n=1 Tax=Photobacterium leiognathi TaxID=553611 RepID=UPI003AF3ED9B
MKRIAIIGSGPRGMSVLERLAVISETFLQPLEIVLIDDSKIGEGRIWDSRQSKNYLMNTLSTEISAFSGHGPVKGARPGSGPSFAEWWQEFHDDFEYYHGVAPRAYYGQYLNFVYRSVQEHLPDHVSLLAVHDKAVDIEATSNGSVVHTQIYGDVECDTVVITTGHSTNEYQGVFKELEQFAAESSGVTFIAGDSSGDIDFSQIEAQENVGVVGLGLAFFDVVSELTEGRGGEFHTEPDGSYRYTPSGKEPKLYCGSRSSLPILARGVNEKDANYKHQHGIFTKAKIQAIRAQVGDNLNFSGDIWPLLEAEVNLAYFKQWIANECSEEQAQRFKSCVIDHAIDESAKIAHLASAYLNTATRALDLNSLARPFEACQYETEKDWQRSLISLLEEDLQAAEKGNIRSPLKSALDVLRHSRDQIRAAVDFGGLSPASHKEFLFDYVPVITLLSAGPPLFRIKQLIALMDVGIISVVPPKMNISMEEEGYQISSEVAPYYNQVVTTLIDARIPTTNIYLDKNPLIKNLLSRGVFTSFNNSSLNGGSFDTGGVNVTLSPFHPIDRDGKPQTGLFVLGIPTEHTRWFMQSGSSRPSRWIDFMVDADAVAHGALYGTEDKSLAA